MEIIKQDSNKITIHEDKINEVVEKMTKKFDIPEDKAKVILGMGVLNGLMMNRIRKV